MDNDVKHFLVECPSLYKSRDNLYDQIVNCISVEKYVSFDTLEPDEKCSFILGGRTLIQLEDIEWQNMMVALSNAVEGMFTEMNVLLNA